MASIFKRKRKVKLASGKTVTRQSQKYYTRLTDADGIKRTIPLFTDKTASEQRAAQLQKEVELAKAGVVDRYKEHRKRPLMEHLDGFRQHLLAKGDTKDYVDLVTSRVGRVVCGCKFLTWADIQPSRVQQCLISLQNSGEGISKRTSNFYLQAIKQFCRWMVQDRRADESPLEHLKGARVLQTDVRHPRRALEPGEVRRFLEATRLAPVRFGMTGPERSMLYRLAIETGLRRKELQSLKA